MHRQETGGGWSNQIKTFTVKNIKNTCQGSHSGRDYNQCYQLNKIMTHQKGTRSFHGRIHPCVQKEYSGNATLAYGSDAGVMSARKRQQCGNNQASGLCATIEPWTVKNTPCCDKHTCSHTTCSNKGIVCETYYRF